MRYQSQLQGTRRLILIDPPVGIVHAIRAAVQTPHKSVITTAKQGLAAHEREKKKCHVCKRSLEKSPLTISAEVPGENDDDDVDFP